MKSIAILTLIFGVTWWSLWLTADQKAQRLMRSGQFESAATLFTDPMRQGVAWYRAGEWENAEQAFARVGSAEAEYNRANALLMQGKYEEATSFYDRVLKLRPVYEDAQINRAIAVARAKMLQSSGGDMGDQKIGADEIVFDKKKSDSGEETTVEQEQAMSDQSMQALWLRKVQSTPADFLKTKFAYQLATEQQAKVETGTVEPASD